MQKNLTQFFEDFIDECQFVRNRRPETIRSSKEAFNHFRKIVPEVSEIAHLSPEVIIVFFKRLQTRERIVGKNQTVIGIKDSTLRTYAGRLITFFKWLVDRGHMPKNPFDKVQLPKPIFNDHRALKGEEIKIIMGTIAQHAPNAFLLKRDMAMVGLLSFCGLRRGELLSLQIQDIDLFNEIITVQGQTSKSKRSRKIPINIFLKRYLEEYFEERKKRNCKTPYLLVSSRFDGPLTKPGLKHWVEKLSNLSGVKFHVHRFRHSFATNLAMQDVGAVKIQNLMGHTSLNMTQVYLRSVKTEDMKDDIGKLALDSFA